MRAAWTLAAAALALAIAARALLSCLRDPELAERRALYVRRGICDGFEHRQLAAILGRHRSRLTRLAARPVAERYLHVARTLMADPRLRSRLGRIAPAAGAPPGCG